MTNPDNQIAKGKEAMIYYHNAASRFDAYNLTIDQLIDQVSKGHASIFLESFGFAIEQLNTDGWFSFGRVKDAMESLAQKGQGKVPANQAAFFKALSDEAQDVSFVDATGFVVVETAKDIASGAQQVGDTLITTFKSFGAIFPIVAIGAVLFIVYKRTKEIAG